MQRVLYHPQNYENIVQKTITIIKEGKASTKQYQEREAKHIHIPLSNATGRDHKQ